MVNLLEKYNPMKNTGELRAELLEIGERLGGGVRPNYYFIIPDKPDGVATPYLEIHGQEYHFVVSERGLEVDRQVTLSDDEILYWFADCGVRALASHYASLKSSSDEPFRNTYFRKQFYLMLSIKPEWATRKKNEFKTLIQR
ncbi:Imm63 family immunity protein [Rahnella perminowiae]|uniref:Imm63 family immunity protein n=1 Tax=Rahnella perminowiae TaxID=2816244 RepID=UPI00300F4391